jgi:hypothetical protein
MFIKITGIRPWLLELPVFQHLKVFKDCHFELITSKFNFKRKTIKCVIKCIVSYFFTLYILRPSEAKRARCKKKKKKKAYSKCFANSFFA